MRTLLPTRQAIRGFASGGAWFFIVVSLMHLAWVVSTKLDSPAGTTKLYHSVVDGHSYDALGLTYTGTLGLVQAFAQGLIVIAAAVASTLAFPRALRVRRMGHLALCAWAGLWAVNFMWLLSVDGRPDTLGQAVVMTLLAACTGYRALAGWTPGRRREKPEPDRQPGKTPVPPAPPSPPGPPGFTESFFNAVYAARVKPLPEPAPQTNRAIRDHLASSLPSMGVALAGVWRWLAAMCSTIGRAIARGFTGSRRVASAALRRIADTARRGAERVAPVSSE